MFNNLTTNEPKTSLKILKCWSLGRLVRPAFKHDVVQGGGTVKGKRQAFAILDLANYFIVFDALEGFDAIHENLPHTHT